MNATSYVRGKHHHLGLFLLGAVLIGMPTDVHALCGLDGAVREQIRHARELSRKTSLWFGTCSVCHLATSGGPRNEYGNSINTLLRLSEGARTDPARQREAGRRMTDILANPLSPNSPTFGELFQQGRFPARSLARQDPPLPEVPVRVSEDITVQQARDLVQEIEAESPFGILQLSRTYELTPAVAEALAEFRGEMLILGLKSLSAEVAAALAKSQAETVWLHSVTSVSPEAAESLVKLPGHLFLTSLAELDSVPLAEKLVARPGALSFPYLTTISPEIAAVLAKNERSLTLAGLTDVSLDVQEKLAKAAGGLSLPNLTSLDSLPLTKKLAASVVLLPDVKKLSAEQAELLLGAKGQGSFWGGIWLPLAAVTPEVANVLAATPSTVNLTLVGDGPLPDAVLRTLLRSRLRLSLRDLEELTASQIRIVAEELADRTVRPGVVESASLSLPNLKKLDSALLAETLVKAIGFNFPGVTEISPEAAAALGALPDGEAIGPEMKRIVVPSGALSFPSLQELSNETARLLMQKRWASISLPALEEVSLETVRLMARQTSSLNLGIPTLPTEFAGAFAELPTRQPMAGDNISFPYLTDLSPEAARILVTSLNRGFREVPSGFGKFSNSPRLSFGGGSGFATLSPELAVELAKYEGNLAIEGLGELPAESAAALASYPGPRLSISDTGMAEGMERLSPEAAAALAKSSAILHIPLRHLDSKPLAERFVQQRGSSTLYNLETVSREAAPALTQYSSFFDLRALRVLDSPEMARRFVEGVTTSNAINLPALATLSPEAAEVLGAGSKSMHLGLTVLDSPAVARALSKSRQGVNLSRLRAATPEVIAILKESKSIQTPPLESLYVLSESNVRP
ncbi:MAG: hypothetical protein KJ000_03365 [Pirellulaceae bacterium]|nr:hypothetical protein [Pirellulaceae bacterium]